MVIALRRYIVADPVLVGDDFHSQFEDLLDYDRKSFVLLVQLVVSSYASFLLLAPSKEQFLEHFPHGETYHQ